MSTSTQLTKINEKTVKKKKMGKKERKEFDRIRQREQQARAKERKLQQFHQDAIQDELRKKTQAWQRAKEHQQEFLLQKLLFDQVDQDITSPICAGYNFYDVGSDDSRCIHPINFGFVLQKLNSRNQDDAAFIHTRDSTKHDDSHTYHPSVHNYKLFKRDSSIISPAFFGLNFHKMSAEDMDDNADEDDTAANSDEEVTANQQGVLEPHEVQRMLYLVRDFQQRGECPICVSINAQGCPGCYVVLSDADVSKSVIKQHKRSRKKPKNWSSTAEEFGKLVGGGILLEEEEEDEYCDDEYDSGEEEAYYSNLLRDRLEVELYREKACTYLDIVIKALPGGSVVRLKVDTKSTVNYLYELYRSNYDDSNRKLFIIFPTATGVFLIDNTMALGTDFANEVRKGDLILEDYKLFPRAAKMPYVFLTVPVLYPERTAKLLQHYLKNNFVVDGKLNLDLHFTPDKITNDLTTDRVQQMMCREVDVMMSAATQNKQMSEEYEFLYKKRMVKQLYADEQNKIFLERKKNKTRPRTKAEKRAWLYFDFVMEESSTYDRLGKLFKCYQKFEELQLIKNGRLRDAASNKDTRNLMKQHCDAVSQACSELLDLEGSTRLPMQMLYLSNGKIVVPIGTRVGINEKEDRKYGLHVRVDLVAEDDLAIQAAAITKNNKQQQPESKKSNSMQVWQLRLRQLQYHDIEWRDRHVSESISLTSDFTMKPFNTVPWDYLVKAFRDAMKAHNSTKELLEEYNNLAGAFRQEKAVLKREMPLWHRKLELLENKLGDQGCLVVACKRLKQKSGMLRKRAAVIEKEEAEKQEKANRRLLALLSAAPTGRLDMKRRGTVKAQELKDEFIKKQSLKAAAEAPKININSMLKATKSSRWSFRSK